MMSTDRGHTVMLLLPRYYGLPESFMGSENYLCDLRGLMRTQGRPTICMLSVKSSVDDFDIELGIVRVRVGLSYDPLRLSPCSGDL